MAFFDVIRLIRHCGWKGYVLFTGRISNLQTKWLVINITWRHPIWPDQLPKYCFCVCWTCLVLSVNVALTLLHLDRMYKLHFIVYVLAVKMDSFFGQFLLHRIHSADFMNIHLSVRLFSVEIVCGRLRAIDRWRWWRHQYRRQAGDIDGWSHLDRIMGGTDYLFYITHSVPYTERKSSRLSSGELWSSCYIVLGYNQLS